MSTASDNVKFICITVLLFAVLGGIFMLAWHKIFTSGEALGIITTIVAAAVGALSHAAGVQASAKVSQAAHKSVTRLPE